MRCVYCGKGFVLDKYHPNQRYCSTACREKEYVPKNSYIKKGTLSGGKYGKDIINEKTSEYLRIYKKQHPNDYQFVQEEYLKRCNQNPLMSFPDAITQKDVNKIKALEI